MSITLVKTPKGIDFAGNWLEFQVSGAYISQYEEDAVIYLGLTGSTSGILQLWNYDTDGLFNITCAAVPSAEANQIHSGLTDIAVIADELNNLYRFQKFYYAQKSGSYLNISLREKTDHIWTNKITLPACFNIVGSPIDGVSRLFKSGYSFFVQIDKFDDSTPVKIVELNYYPSVDGDVSIFLENIIKAHIPIVLPTLNSASIFYQTLFKVLAKFAETYVVSGASRINRLYSYMFYAIRGRIAPDKYADYDICNEIEGNFIFLNHFKSVDIYNTANYLLHLFNTASTEKVNVKVKIYYTDQTTHTATAHSFACGGSYQVVSFNASMAVLGLVNYNPTKEIYKYEVWVEHADTSILCNEFTFNVIEKPMHVKEFAFLNKFGLIEIFHAVSKTDMTLTVEKYIVKLDNGSISDTGIEAYNKFKVATGSLSQEDAIELQYMLSSEAFYEIINNEYVKCLIEPSTFNIIEENSSIISIEFAYRKTTDL